MKFAKPSMNQVFSISSKPEWPHIEFQTDASGPHVWNWTLKWKTFTKSGTATTAGNQWNATTAITDLGGTLSVTAKAGNQSVVIAVKIVGTNPSTAEATAYLSGKPDSSGFDKILQQESKFKHFNDSHEPIKSFDNGYGMCQLTTPTPSFAQVWNWKLNIDGGLALFAQKRSAAVAYLSQSGRSYTKDQLKREAVCRWNGGSYHDWNSTTSQWVRKANILCDSKTGNIGWDMNDASNSGKTESQLHQRDHGSYGSPPAAGAHWKYSGVCYADHLLG